MRWVLGSKVIAGGEMSFAAVLGCLLASCAAGLNEAPLAEDEGNAPVVAILHTRDHELTITGRGAGQEGLRYTLVDAEGELEEHLTLEQLAQRDRDLYELVKSAMARSGPPRLDARITPEQGNADLSAARDRIQSAIYRDRALPRDGR